MRRTSNLLVVVAVLLGGRLGTVRADEVAALRLAPFPKQAAFQQGTFPLDEELVLEAPAASAQLLGGLIGGELRRAGLPTPKVRAVADDAKYVRLSARPGDAPSKAAFRPKATPGEYLLEIRPDAAVCLAPGDAGLLYGVQTLRQLIRANRRGSALPCLKVRDWPSLAWRCFFDDMTRGPSAKLDTLKFDMNLGSELKMNLFTYYMEYQFAFKKHPAIWPKDGSFTPEELKALVAYAQTRHVDILGGQQSFAHYEHILNHPEYAACRETENILCPVREETYRLLDDFYSEVAPLTPFPWFMPHCDEPWALGTGPSKELAAKIGVAGVYLQHVRRVHDLLKNKYGKRMLLADDIILNHPDKIDQIPKDVIIETWRYEARSSYEDQIMPFVKGGYEFFVCPGINDWNRILPDFGVATVNIQNFVRDGAKHGALGMINMAWKDDGEAVRGYNWHGYAWGAECAWNASATRPADFNRRIGAVPFGEKGDHFGRAIDLLAKTHRLPIAAQSGMSNVRFWRNDFVPRGEAAANRAAAEQLLGVVRPAIEHLEACKKDAVLNVELLDSFLFGAPHGADRPADARRLAVCRSLRGSGPRDRQARRLEKAGGN